MKQLELFEQYEMFDCSCHGHVKAANHKCSYCEAGWKCDIHGPYNPTTSDSVFISKFGVENEPELRCPRCFEKKYGAIPPATLSDSFYDKLFANIYYKYRKPNGSMKK